MRTNSVLEKIVELFKTDFLGPPAVACPLTAAMRKLITILNSMVRTDQLWREPAIS